MYPFLGLLRVSGGAHERMRGRETEIKRNGVSNINLNSATAGWDQGCALVRLDNQIYNQAL